MSKQDIQALYSLEASVLGAVLLQSDTLALFPRLEVLDFAHGGHRVVFAAIRNLEAKNLPIDVVTVQAEIARSGYTAVDFAFLGDLVLHVPTVENAVEYVRQIREASLGRRVRVMLGDLLSKSDELSGAELLSMAMAGLSKIDEDQPDATVGIMALVKERMAQLEKIADERASGARTMTGFPTGVRSLDEKLGGVQPGIVTIVAARPAMGKSSLGLAITDACSAAGFGAHLFSLEDTRASYADRTISRSSSVPAQKLRNADLTKGDCSDIARGVGGLRKRRWLVDDRSGITADEIIRSVRRHRKENGTCVVVVDYVQLVKYQQPRGHHVKTHEALDEIATAFMNAAKQDGLAYVVLSQLNRSLESRQDKRPMMSDLRESGALEERAKCVIGLYRGSYYGPPVKGIDWDPAWRDSGHGHQPSDEEHAAQIQLCVLKNNNGPTGPVFAHWDGPTTTIS